MTLMKRVLFVLLLLVSFNLLKAQVTHFKLENGLTVIINEDHRVPSIFGSIVVKAGSVDESPNATGLAHYLEHMMFKGSTNVGTIDWDKEKIHYNKIIELYDLLGTVPVEKRDSIQQLINEESLLAGQYTVNNEFSNLIQSIGGTSLNAATGYDVTYYHNSFPSFQLKKWLELNADRFANPVFRGFQAELETVYEEKNMYSDNPYSVLFEEFSSEMFGSNNPYSRSIVGNTEHLKTPSLSQLIEFYNKFYVPANMALVLSGDVNVADAQVYISETLGSWQPKPAGTRNVLSEANLDGKKKSIKKKLTPMPMLIMGYKGIPVKSEDTYKMEVLQRVLNNRNSTGLLDKLVLDGDVQSLSVSINSFRQAGLINFMGIPVYDMAQKRFSSLSYIESSITKTLDQLMDGNVEDWLIQSVKDDLIMEFELSKESNVEYGMMLVNAFGNDESIDAIENYVSQINAISKNDLVLLAKKYFDKPYLAMHSMTGEPSKEKLSKPNYKPIVPASGKVSDYAQKWLAEQVNIPEFTPVDFRKDFEKTELTSGVTLFYTQNPYNDIFSLTIKFGAGSAQIRELDFSTRLMNRAGIMALYTPNELKKAFGQLGCVVNFSNDRNYTYISIRGKESSLARVCNLLSKTYLMPSIEEKQMKSLLGREFGQRSVEKKEKDLQADALNEYIKYGKNSSYLNRLSNQEIMELTVTSLAAAFIKATQFETSVHYTGKYPVEEVKKILTKNLVFQSDLKPSASPISLPLEEYSENTIFLVNNKNARQSDIFLFRPGIEFSKDDKSRIDAFNQYFGGGFNGLVLQQLRELQSLAYTASANYSIPPLEGYRSMFTAYIGTQADKTLDAVSGYMTLINNMPQYPERLTNIRGFLNQTIVTASPSFRYRTMLVENWMRNGYSLDPRIKWKEEYSSLTFEDVYEFYNLQLKDKPVAIGIVVNTKNIDLDKLKTFGKVIEVKPKSLFKD